MNDFQIELQWIKSLEYNVMNIISEIDNGS